MCVFATANLGILMTESFDTDGDKSKKAHKALAEVDEAVYWVLATEQALLLN